MCGLSTLGDGHHSLAMWNAYAAESTRKLKEIRVRHFVNGSVNGVVRLTHIRCDTAHDILIHCLATEFQCAAMWMNSKHVGPKSKKIAICAKQNKTTEKMFIELALATRYAVICAYECTNCVATNKQANSTLRWTTEKKQQKNENYSNLYKQ